MIAAKGQKYEWDFRLESVLSSGTIAEVLETGKPIDTFVESTFVYLAELVDQGLTFGNEIIDNLISLQGSTFAEKGVDKRYTLYKVFCRGCHKSSISESHKIQIAEFMRQE